MTYNTYKSQHYAPAMGINACSRLTYVHMISMDFDYIAFHRLW